MRRRGRRDLHRRHRPARCSSATCRWSPSPVATYLEAGWTPRWTDADEETGDLVQAVDRLLAHADATPAAARCGPTPTPPRTPRAPAGSAPQGIGLCRTEHMFLGDRRDAGRAADPGRTAAGARTPRWTRCCRCSARTSSSILEAMDGLPVTIRLLDPPLHEFLPDRTELSVRVAVAEATGADADARRPRLLRRGRAAARAEPDARPARRAARARRCPGLFAMQVRAIAEAAGERDQGRRRPAGRRSWCRWSASVMELHLVRDEADADRSRGRRRRAASRLDIPIGTMIELPRAALTAGRIAEAADFFSFGTNDLTQTTWGFSRDDVEAAFFAAYLEKGIFTVSPVRDARRRRRRPARPDRRRGGPARPARTSRSASAASTAATPSRSTSSTTSASTTCPARRSASRSPGSRPAGQP